MLFFAIAAPNNECEPDLQLMNASLVLNHYNFQATGLLHVCVFRVEKNRQMSGLTGLIRRHLYKQVGWRPIVRRQPD